MDCGWQLSRLRRYYHPTASARSLEVEFDAILKLDRQLSAMCKGIHYHLSNIACIRPYISKEACEHACRAVALSRLDYANSVLYGASNSKIQRLQCVQNRAAKLIFKARKRVHVTPLLQHLHWLPVRKCILFKILTITYGTAKKKRPGYLVGNLVATNWPIEKALHAIGYNQIPTK